MKLATTQAMTNGRNTMINKNVSLFSVIRLFVVVSALFAVAYVWTSAAYAQLPQDVQYTAPEASGERAIAAAGTPSEDPASVLSATTGTPSEGVAGVVGLLPETGGPLLTLAALAAFALSSTGLLAMRLLGRRE